MAKSKKASTCHPNLPNQARGLCNTCYRRWWNEQNPGGSKRIRENRPRASCHPDKPQLARDLCATCYRREWRKENPGAEWVRSTELQKLRYAKRTETERRAIMLGRYGLTESDYEQMKANQGGVCAACRLPSGRRLQVDHCHDTGAIRGLLCGNCNSALGHAKDDVARLQSLIAYLQASSTTSC